MNNVEMLEENKHYKINYSGRDACRLCVRWARSRWSLDTITLDPHVMFTFSLDPYPCLPILISLWDTLFLFSKATPNTKSLEELILEYDDEMLWIEAWDLFQQNIDALRWDLLLPHESEAWKDTIALDPFNFMTYVRSALLALIDTPEFNPDFVRTPQNTSYKENYDLYLQSTPWKTIRLAILCHADFRCQICNSPLNLQVHHRSYTYLGEELEHDLIALCDTCHGIFHKHGRLYHP